METEDLFKRAISLSKKKKSALPIGSAVAHVLDEVIRRLETEMKNFSKIQEQHKGLIEKDESLNNLGKATQVENIEKLLLEQSKKDPKLAAWFASNGGHIQLVQSVGVSATNLTTMEESGVMVSEELLELQQMTETMYESLWKVGERLKCFPGLGKFKPSGVRDVRNMLIQHTENPNSGASIFSFGLSTNGPVLRPIRPTGAKAISDRGLDINVNEFLSELIRAIQ